MTFKDDVWTFESTGRRFTDYSDNPVFSPFSDGTVGIGYDNSVFVYDQDPTEVETDLQPLEKREFALFMIDVWKKFGGIENT